MERSAQFLSCLHIRSLTVLLAEVNLSELQKTLDAQGLEVVEYQKESVVGRKVLSDRTKGECAAPPSYAVSPSADFKKLPDDEKLGAIKALVKGAPLTLRRLALFPLTRAYSVPDGDRLSHQTLQKLREHIPERVQSPR